MLLQPRSTVVVVVVSVVVVVGVSDVEIVVKAASGSGCSVASFAFRLTPVEELPFGKAKSTWQSGLGNRMRKELVHCLPERRTLVLETH